MAALCSDQPCFAQLIHGADPPVEDRLYVAGGGLGKEVLHQRRHTRRGRVVDISFLGPATPAILSFYFSLKLVRSKRNIETFQP